jgi:5'(3')-deoxyribonucleotidase
MKEVLIYCDMDGVLVDFDKGYFDLTGVDLKGAYSTDPNFWDPIKEAGYDFWFNLKWRNDGKRLWRYIKKYDPVILSAPSREMTSIVGKQDWIKKELPGTHLVLKNASLKKELARPNVILIDDRSENIDDWNNAGGNGILFTSTVDTIKKLRKLGF